MDFRSQGFADLVGREIIIAVAVVAVIVAAVAFGLGWVLS